MLTEPSTRVRSDGPYEPALRVCPILPQANAAFHYSDCSRCASWLITLSTLARVPSSSPRHSSVFCSTRSRLASLSNSFAFTRSPSTVIGVTLALPCLTALRLWFLVKCTTSLVARCCGVRGRLLSGLQGLRRPYVGGSHVPDDDVLYVGSGGCAGCDQSIFHLPTDGPTGCAVPIIAGVQIIIPLNTRW